ncbi:radial spoke head protein 3 homolog B-like isoform X2 [Aphis gossypii]|uniref:radial spoke head protein 3 homolog B-like isoform X2 n=1 Tax=Aphis gossypii TaxID=80765 RepID=UPI0021590FC5|nr:radial spoke head protein 3 homolog B-like isoform X2 [Aphis gossypii]
MRENSGGTDGSGGDDRTSSSFTVINDDHDRGGRSRRRYRDHHRGHHDHRDQHSRDREPRHFARTLDSKLNKLQRQTGDGVKHASRKPVFVTTVKTGIFLDPPPDLAALLGLDDRSSPSAVDSDRYYSYSSKPRVLHDRQHQRCTVSYSSRKTDAQPDMCKQMGYTNIMHDKRVVRGSNFSKKPFLGKESSASREAEARRRAMARKKAIDYQTRALRLHLGAPKLTRGRQNVDIQTDVHLEELYDYPVSQTFGAQTEFDLELFSNPGTGTSAGTDASTQVDDKDLFDFDTEVTPIAEALIADVFRQAMREVLYEDELEARERQQRTLCMRRKVEEIEKQRLQYEDERLNKVIAEHTQMFDEGEKNEKARMSILTSGRVTDLLPKVIEDLNQEGLSTNSTINKLESPEFVSWLTEELQADKTKHTDSDDILKSIIHDLIKRRLDLYNETTDVKDIEQPEELFKEMESITLESDNKNELHNPTSDS